MSGKWTEAESRAFHRKLEEETTERKRVRQEFVDAFNSLPKPESKGALRDGSTPGDAINYQFAHIILSLIANSRTHHIDAPGLLLIRDALKSNLTEEVTVKIGKMLGSVRVINSADEIIRDTNERDTYPW